jgi:hypothetical protein
LSPTVQILSAACPLPLYLQQLYSARTGTVHWRATTQVGAAAAAACAIADEPQKGNECQDHHHQDDCNGQPICQPSFLEERSDTSINHIHHHPHTLPCLPAAAAATAYEHEDSNEHQEHHDYNDCYGHAAEGVPCHVNAQLPRIVPRLHLRSKPYSLCCFV